MLIDWFLGVDWRHIFLGDVSAFQVIEVVFRTIFMYLWALFITRIVGKRVVGDLSAFDYIIVVAVGSATGKPMMFLDIPLVHGMVVLASIVAVEFLITWLARRSGRVERVLSSTPSPLVRNGQILHERLQAERMTTGELMSMLRLSGICDTGQVEHAWLEPSGRLSVIVRATPPDAPQQTTFPPRNVEDASRVTPEWNCSPCSPLQWRQSLCRRTVDFITASLWCVCWPA